jgi:hypothetical protein
LRAYAPLKHKDAALKRCVPGSKVCAKALQTGSSAKPKHAARGESRILRLEELTKFAHSNASYYNISLRLKSVIFEPFVRDLMPSNKSI